MPSPESSEPRPPSRAKALRCPKCGTPAINSFDLDGDWAEYPGITRTEAVCGNGHIWSMRWAESVA